jgi:RimJ/RimL family protein N-acetyltransferase
VTVVLETARLRLREMEPGDLDFVAAMLGDPEVMRYYPRVSSRAEAQAWLDRQRKRYIDDGHGLWLVEERATGMPAGQVGLSMQEVEGARRPEVGWLLHRPCWGKGYATEASRVLLRLSFEDLHLHRVYGRVEARNLGSARVLEKLGMRREAHLVENEFVKGEWQSELTYAILATEWRAAAED